MAEEKAVTGDTEKLFARRYNSVKEKQFKFYSKIDDAVNDPDPRLDTLVHKVSIELLGEIKLVLVPVAGEAVRALVSVTKPKDAKPGKGAKK